MNPLLPPDVDGTVVTVGTFDGDLSSATGRAGDIADAGQGSGTAAARWSPSSRIHSRW
jgi:hypothetical protein